MSNRCAVSLRLLSLIAVGVTGLTALTGPAALPAAMASARQVAQVDCGDPALQDDCDTVEWIALHDPRAVVRNVAWRALLVQPVAASVRRFLDVDYDYAVSLAAARDSRDKDFVDWVLRSYVPEFSPNVVAAARAARDGSRADRAYFVDRGYAEAKSRDRAAREAQGQQAAAVLAADRAFVAALAEHDPGAQVRLTAGYALRSGATDTDLAEFLTSGWAYSARLDQQQYRTELNDVEVSRRRLLNTLLERARAAEAAANQTAGEAAEQARAAAARAWAEVGEQARTASSAWTEAEQAAQAQVRAWQAVAEAAAATLSGNWASMAATAPLLGQDWAEDSVRARSQATSWTDLYLQALAAEQHWQQAPS